MGDRAGLVIATFPIAGIVTYAVSYPLDVPLAGRLVVLVVAWVAAFQVCGRYWPD